MGFDSLYNLIDYYQHNPLKAAEFEQILTDAVPQVLIIYCIVCVCLHVCVVKCAWVWVCTAYDSSIVHCFFSQPDNHNNKQ